MFDSTLAVSRVCTYKFCRVLMRLKFSVNMQLGGYMDTLIKRENGYSTGLERLYISIKR